MDKIIITGATGFIGSHLVDIFVKNGYKPICLVRKNSNLEFLDTGKVEVAYGDILDVDSLDHCFKKAAAVIHNAACVSDWGDYEKFYRTNVQGSLNVLKACRKHTIKQVIMTGTTSCYGEENCPQKKDESWPYNSHYPYFLDRIFPCRFNYYRDSKALATKKAIEFARKHSINLTILEPSWVYGEREFNTGFYQYLKTAQQGIPFIPGSKKNKFQLIYAPDLAQFYFNAYAKKLKGIHRIIVCSKEAPYMNEIYRLFCREAGLKKPANVPKWLVYPPGFLLELVYTVCKSKKPPLLTRARVNLFYDNLEYSIKKAEQLLGPVAFHSLNEGIAKTVQWYKKKGYV
jgi:nucleoside-diphosphate-sugar epimerase